MCLQRANAGFFSSRFSKTTQGGAKNYQSNGKVGSSVTSTTTLSDSKSSAIRCWNCNQLGHRASSCKSTPKGSTDAKRTGKEKSFATSQTSVAKANTNHVGVVMHSEPNVTSCNLIGARLAYPIPELRFPQPEIMSSEVESETHKSVISCFDDDLPLDANSVSTVRSGDNVLDDSNIECLLDVVDTARQTESQGMGDDSCIESSKQSIPLCLSELKYRDISFKELSEPIKCLEDSGAQISVIKEEFMDKLNLPVVGTISIKGIIGLPLVARLVKLNIKPYPGEGCENIAPYLSIVFLRHAKCQQMLT